jgi:hypothetical protein
MVSQRKVLALWAIALAIFLAVVNAIVASPFEARQNMSAWTKAICTDDNYCIDVRITCVDGKVTDIKPMGPGVQFSGIWMDKRPKELRNGICI